MNRLDSLIVWAFEGGRKVSYEGQPAEGYLWKDDGGGPCLYLVIGGEKRFIHRYFEVKRALLARLSADPGAVGAEQRKTAVVLIRLGLIEEVKGAFPPRTVLTEAGKEALKAVNDKVTGSGWRPSPPPALLPCPRRAVVLRRRECSLA